MQTFLPYPSYTDSARVLDYRRLGKQRVECIQILNALSNPAYGWQNHPAVKMWRGYESNLAEYARIICIEWRARGYNDSCLDKIIAIAKFDKTIPDWVTDDFCLSHQSNLKRKNPAYYSPFFPDIPDNLPYIWPK